MTKPIIALDFNDQQTALNFVNQFDETLFVKVGMELYYRSGPEIIYELKNLGHQIFLDLKCHDIPNTVGKALEVVASLEVDMVNVHALGGRNMMLRAKESIDRVNKDTKLIAVTQLTSTNEQMIQYEQNIPLTMRESVLNLATLAHDCHLDGVVCSVQEAELLTEQLGRDFLKVTPGIRLKEDSVDDQVRIATPTVAKLSGSTHIVVGRSITQHDNPIERYNYYKSVWEG